MTTFRQMISAIAFGAFLITGAAYSKEEPSKQAPDFAVKDAHGDLKKLSDYKGQWLVLEWFNKDCPFVKKHYGSNNMQALQKKYTEKGVKWVQVISSAPGKQGHLDGKSMIAVASSDKHAATTTLLDEDGTVGKAYGATTTPHMFVINPKGVIVYAGAIDDNESSDPSVIPESKNYVAAALDEAMAEKPVSIAATKSYGCAVKY